MHIVPPLLFGFAAIVAFLTIRRSVLGALPAIRAMRAELALPAERVIHVTTLDTRCPVDEPQIRNTRPRRRLMPKPITHRLHHFPHRVCAA